ncbi:hypothetical protein JCM24511_04369 [Saitozyma sp. JCM 24511]|nr:hypothetical protein JCM24511_04369 [Saitozyma sp. JCM 24511]
MDAAYAMPSSGSLSSDGAASRADAPKRLVDADLPKAIDLSHHLSRLAVHRQASSLKQLYQYMTVPGMITMAGGIPSPEYFPFETLSASIQLNDTMPLDPPRVPAKPKKSLLSWLFPSTQDTSSFTIPKYVSSTDPKVIQLATSLQYQAATGPPALSLFLRQYVEKIYKPAYADWDVLLNVGATDGWNKICGLLMEQGDAVLVEEWTYPGAENAFIPMEVEMVAIKMDGQGVLPEHMDEVLGTWDEEKRGKKRPHVFYTIPTGQNPTGATMMGERKKAIYEICKKYDVIICEDEPYYCLFSGEWTPKSHKSHKSVVAERAIEAEKKEGKDGNEAFIAALPPTYLTYDTDGRVIRMDTFSKTSCPGSRLGWFTSSPLFIERLTRATEAGTQAPSGFATALTTTLLQTWGFDGYVRWLRGIKATYRMRKTWICDTFEDVFHLEFEEAGSLVSNPSVLDVGMNLGKGVTCYAKPKTGTVEAKWDEKRGLTSKRGPALVSFIPPTAGMFIFLGVHISEHPDYPALVRKGEDAKAILMDKLWRELAENLVLFAPGFGFDAKGPHAIGGEGMGYFRLSFSIATYEQTRTAIETFAKVLYKFYRI